MSLRSPYFGQEAKYIQESESIFSLQISEIKPSANKHSIPFERRRVMVTNSRNMIADYKQFRSKKKNPAYNLFQEVFMIGSLVDSNHDILSVNFICRVHCMQDRPWSNWSAQQSKLHSTYIPDRTNQAPRRARLPQKERELTWSTGERSDLWIAKETATCCSRKWSDKIEWTQLRAVDGPMEEDKKERSDRPTVKFSALFSRGTGESHKLRFGRLVWWPSGWIEISSPNVQRPPSRWYRPFGSMLVFISVRQTVSIAFSAERKRTPWVWDIAKLPSTLKLTALMFVRFGGW